MSIEFPALMRKNGYPYGEKLEKTMKAKVINLKQKESFKKQENASCRRVHITLLAGFLVPFQI
jgi:hypothetical protein